MPEFRIIQNLETLKKYWCYHFAYYISKLNDSVHQWCYFLKDRIFVTRTFTQNALKIEIWNRQQFLSKLDISDINGTEKKEVLGQQGNP